MTPPERPAPTAAPVRVDPPAGSGPPPGFFRRRLVDPLRAQLTQGVAPEQLAFTLGLGTACSLLPFLGFTSLLNLVAGFAFRLNHPILQILNQLLGPLQLALVLPYVRAGERIWNVEGGARFTLGELIAAFRDAPLLDFLARFGWAGIHAFTAWIITVPFLVAAIHYTTRPALRRLAGAIRRPPETAP
jgi:hypothetical protein